MKNLILYFESVENSYIMQHVSYHLHVACIVFQIIIRFKSINSRQVTKVEPMRSMLQFSTLVEP